MATTKKRPARRPVDKLHRAVTEIKRDHPLPRCTHGAALRDHAGEHLEPPCGCVIGSALRKGDTVRMSESLKDRMRANGSSAHVHEFGQCVGVVQGFTDYNARGAVLDIRKIGPEVDVHWQPSNLRYAYHPSDLEVVK